MQRWLPLFFSLALLTGCGEPDNAQSTEKKTDTLSVSDAAKPSETVEQLLDLDGQTPITPAMVEGLIASYPEFKAMTDKYFPGDLEGEDIDRTAGNLGDQWIAKLKERGVLGEYNAMARKSGFTDFRQWAQAWISTFVALLWTDPKRSPDTQLADIAQSLKEIEANPQLSAEQKAAMKKSMEEAAATFQKMKAPPANVAVVTPYKEKLEALVKQTE